MLLWSFLIAALLATSSAFNLPGVPINFAQDDAVLSAISDDVAHKFENEYLAYIKTGVESATLRQISRQLAQSHSKKDLFTKDVSELGAADEFFVCTTCRATVNVLSRMFREEDGELNGPDAEKNARRVMLDICARLEIQTEEVCAGLFESEWPTVEYITQHSIIDSRSFCSLFLGYSFCNVKNPEYDWTLTIDQSIGEITSPKKEVPKKSANDLRILHVTDIHYDPLYEPGTLAECDEPLCCQRHKATAEGTSKAAGYWGDYRDCDSPWHTIENAFEHMKSTHAKIDYIYQTGDVVDHMVWATSVKKNNEVLTKVSDKLAEMFPGIPVYPCIGNHEPHPLNHFSTVDAPENVNTKWLYEQLYKDWSKWLPESTKETILKGGYYTVSPKSGFRIVALNDNDCYTDNFWLYHSGTTKMPQLQWLHDVLLAAEKAGENVHILAHIPSGDGTCWAVWSGAFSSLIERFSATVSGVFNGHTHKDEMNVYYSTKGHALGIAWNGGSLTPFSYNNPNYRVYEVEPVSMQVVDHETWIFNLTEANLQGAAQKPNWFKEYTFTADFTDDLSPAGIDNLLEKMASTPDLLRKFWRYKMTSADPRLAEGCNRNCLLNTICRIATTVNNQRTRCEELKTKLELALDNETTTPETPVTTVGPELTTPEDDGAASIIALKLSSLLALYVFVKYLF